MFRASRVLRMAVTKTTTGIVGLPVNPNARQDLIKLYQRTLREIQVRSEPVRLNLCRQLTLSHYLLRCCRTRLPRTRTPSSGSPTTASASSRRTRRCELCERLCAFEERS